MIAVLIILLLLAFAGAVWWFGPEVKDELETARRRRRVDQLKQRTLADIEFLREQAWQERDARSREQLRRLGREYHL